MTEQVNVALSAVDAFAKHSPTDEDVESVKELLESVARNPSSGVAVPFTSERLGGIYVTWTPNRKWRIVFRPKTPSGLDVLSIDPEQT
jgi:hypothetical protein